MVKATALEEVVSAIVALGVHPRLKVYVERRGPRYRWSPATRGGPHVLLREVSRLLDLPPASLRLEAASVDGWSVLAPAQRSTAVVTWALLDTTDDPVRLRSHLTALIQQA